MTTTTDEYADCLPHPASYNGHVPMHERGPTWCAKCGTFSCYWGSACEPKPESERFWLTAKGWRTEFFAEGGGA